MKRFQWTILMMTVLLAGVTICRAEGDLVAKVNGVSITKAEFDRNWAPFLQQKGIPVNHADKSGKVEEFRSELIELMVDQELLYQDADKQGFGAKKEQLDEALAKSTQGFPSPEEFEKVLAKNGLTLEGYRDFLQRRFAVDNMLRKQLADVTTVSDKEVDDFYSGNPQQFAVPEQVRARHILIKVEKGATEDQKAAARKKIEEVRTKAEGGADFAELAKESSEGPSAPKGGDLGFFGRGRMVPAFEKAAFALKPGEISGVVETPFGYHIILVEEKKEGGTVPKEEVAEKVRDFLKQQKVAEAVQERIKTLRDKAKIEIL
jgi:peptidyl-prolyl cis-trans isomerase C